MCVLIVEDEHLIRMMLAEEFSGSGFEICEAASGEQAAIYIADPPCPFTLLITDIHMPGRPDGLGVAAIMHARHPKVPVIVTTGRPDVALGGDLVVDGYVVIAKPYLPSELLQLARTLLGHAINREND